MPLTCTTLSDETQRVRQCHPSNNPPAQPVGRPNAAGTVGSALISSLRHKANPVKD